MNPVIQEVWEIDCIIKQIYLCIYKESEKIFNKLGHCRDVEQEVSFSLNRVRVATNFSFAGSVCKML
jgi:hypothetical protein